MEPDKKHIFRKELQKLINCHSMENGCNTPDFLLAEYLSDCLDSFDRVVKAREKWYGREAEPVCPQPPIPMSPPSLPIPPQERHYCKDHAISVPQQTEPAPPAPAMPAMKYYGKKPKSLPDPDDF